MGWYANGSMECFERYDRKPHNYKITDERGQFVNRVGRVISTLNTNKFKIKKRFDIKIC